LIVINAIRGFFQELFQDFGSKYECQILKLEEDATKEVDELLSQIGKKECKKLQEEIEKRIKSVDVKPAYGNEVISICKQILSFGIAGFAIAIAFANKIKEIPEQILPLIGFSSLFYLNLIVLSLYILFKFLWQSRQRYPFLYFQKIGNTIPYFYYRTISSETSRDAFQTHQERLSAMKLYSQDLLRFVRYIMSTNRREQGFLRDDLQQYFLLLSYQGYVNQKEVRITNSFIYGLIASMLSTIVVFLLYQFSTI